MTLPEPDTQGERWDRELRAGLGAVFCQESSLTTKKFAKRWKWAVSRWWPRQSPAAQQFVHLAETLGLTAEASARLSREAPLLEIAVSMQAAGVFVRNRVAIAIASSETIVDEEPVIFELPEPEALALSQFGSASLALEIEGSRTDCPFAGCTDVAVPDRKANWPTGGNNTASGRLRVELRGSSGSAFWRQLSLE